MAFPVVESRTCTTYTTSVNISSLDIDFPSSVASDDLLILIVSRSLNKTIATPAGWTVLSNNSTGGSYGRLATFYKQASGNEGGTTVTVSLTSGTTPSMAGVIYEISGWNDTEISVNDASGIGTVADFDSLTPSWGAKDTLWIAAVGTGDEGELVTNFAADGFATNGANCRSDRGLNKSCNIGNSYQSSNTATLDPANWTIADSENVHEHLIGVEPGTKGGGGAFNETALVSITATVTVTETYTAPAYDETASVTATPTLEASETFGAAAYNETATLTALAIVAAVEQYAAGGNNETAAITATATVTAAETYIAPGYTETAAISATATVTAAEGFTEPGAAYDETATVTGSATVTATEEYTGPSYTETAAVSFAALVAASEIYAGPESGETATISAAATVTAVETWEPPDFFETSTITLVGLVTATDVFNTPSRLPAGISTLSAEPLSGFSAELLSVFYARKH